MMSDMLLSLWCCVCDWCRPYNDNGKEAECNFFVCDTKGNEDMTSEQKELVDVYSGFSVAMFVVVVLWGIVYKIYTSVRKFYHGN